MSSSVVYEDFQLVPGVPVLAHTKEIISLPKHVVARVEGKSTWGRQFLLIHMTAGFIDPGFSGQITLEMVNLGADIIDLTPGMPICQVSFEYLDRPCLREYGHPELGSKYQGQQGPASARLEAPLLPAIKYDGGPRFPGDLLANDGSPIE